MRKVFVTRHIAVSTTTPTLVENLAKPMWVNLIQRIYTGAKQGVRLPMHNLYRMLDMPSFAPEAPKRGGFFFAAGNVAAAGLDLHYANPNAHTSYTYRIPIYSGINIFAGQCANEVGMTEVIATDATACASSMKALWDAWAMIKMRRIDRAIVVACEEQTTNMMLEFFGKEGVALTAEQEAAGKKPSAFDPVNGGFRIGNGAAAFLLEAEGHESYRPVAELTGVAMSGEKHTPALGQDDRGSGYIRVLQELQHLDASRPDIIKAHGTGTEMNNRAEAFALERVFGAGGFLATSYKPLLGHTMGASGLVEMSRLLGDIEQGFVRGIANKTVDTPGFLSGDLSGDFKSVICLSAGMGNVYGGAKLSIA